MILLTGNNYKKVIDFLYNESNFNFKIVTNDEDKDYLTRHFLDKFVSVNSLDIFLNNLVNKSVISTKKQKILFYKATQETKLTILKNHNRNILSEVIKYYEDINTYEKTKDKLDNKIINDFNNIINNYLSILSENNLFDEFTIIKELNKISFLKQDLILFLVKPISSNKLTILLNILSDESIIYLNYSKNNPLEDNYNQSLKIKNIKEVELIHNNSEINNSCLSKKIGKTNEIINIIKASDIYDEALIITNEIGNILNKGHHLNDILIVGKDIDNYLKYFKLLFDKTNINYSYSKTFNQPFYLIRDILNYIFKKDKNILFNNLLNINKISIDYFLNTNDETSFIYTKYLNPLNIENYSVENIVITIYNYLTSLNIHKIIDQEFTKKIYEFLDIVNDDFKDLSVEELLDLTEITLHGATSSYNYLDSVTLSTYKYSLKPYKFIFYISHNEGVVNTPRKHNLLLNEKTYNKLFKNFNITNYTTNDNYLLNMNMYKAENIYISYKSIGKDGKNILISDLLTRLISSHETNHINKNNYSFKSLLKDNYKLLKNNKLNEILDKEYKETELIQREINILPTHLSPSSINNFVNCPYRFFLNNVLKINKAKERKINAIFVGNYIHRAYELLIKEDNYDILDQVKEEFKEKNKLDSKLNDYLIELINQNILVTYPVIKKELANTNFLKSYTEVNIMDKIKPLFINNIAVQGIIDRLDLTDTHFRVVDYKTGNNKYDIVETLNGINLQLLIYMITLEETLKLKPSSMFYIPSFKSFNNQPNKFEGLIIDEIDNHTILNLDPDIINYQSRGKDKPDVILSKERYQSITKFTSNILKEIVTNITTNQFRVYPLDKEDTCKYCDYSYACKIEESDDKKEYKKYNKEEINEILNKN